LHSDQINKLEERPVNKNSSKHYQGKGMKTNEHSLRELWANTTVLTSTVAIPEKDER
jgi:hypothetical protein